MAEPAREQALAYLVTLFQGMTGTRPWGGTYPNDPLVTRVLLEPAQINQFPYLIIKEGAGSSFALAAIGAAALGHFEDRFKVAVYGFVQRTTDAESTTWLQRLLDDVRRRLAADQTLGGICREIMFDGTEVVDEGDLEPLAAFVWDFTVIIDLALTVG